MQERAYPMPPMNVLMKPASGNCNMKCDYCFYSDEQKNRKVESFGYMKEDTLRNIIRKTLFHAQGSCTFAFQGGEPTLVGLDFYHKVMEYAEKYNKNGLKIYYALQTNGVNITEEWCRFFKKYNFLVGLSIDGTKSIHDLYRHSKRDCSSYEYAGKAAELMSSYGVDYNILTVVHKETAGHVAEIYEEYKQKGWNYQQYIACLDPLFQEPGTDEFSVLPEEYGDFLITLFGLWFEDLKQNKQPYIRQFENYVGILLGYRPEACEQCGTCGVQYVVEADGSVYPCDFYMLDEYCLGNFNDTTINNMDIRRNEIGFIERSRNISSECISCEYQFICKGGCQRNRREMQEGIYHNNLCLGYKKFFEVCLPSLIEIANVIKKSR